jgi:uncharacterized protein (TIGR03067 family)
MTLTEATAHSTATADPAEIGQIQGLWVSVAGRRPAEFRIQGRRFTVWFADGDLYTGDLDVVIDERPRTMLMRIADGPPRHKGKVALCIYELEGDLMRWCPAEPGADDPPADFPAVDDPRHLCTVFRLEPPRLHHHSHPDYFPARSD